MLSEKDQPLSNPKMRRENIKQVLRMCDPQESLEEDRVSRLGCLLYLYNWHLLIFLFFRRLFLVAPVVWEEKEQQAITIGKNEQNENVEQPSLSWCPLDRLGYIFNLYPIVMTKDCG